MAGDDITIRPAVSGDLPAIGALWLEMMEYHRALDPHFVAAPDGEEKWLEHVAGKLDDEKWWLAVAEKDGVLVAYCTACEQELAPVFLNRRIGFISDLAVTAACRRSGIGKRLTQAALDRFASRGIARVEVNVATTNPVSTAFWRKMGFAAHVQRMHLQTLTSDEKEQCHE
ncbi:MAG: GNAT family N-acetyltransferase [Planctomycetota bacterium]|jgi:ribosomal protein S18 acetylase RimI-like enzyme